MNPELSRRAGQVMHYSPIVDQTIKEREKFINAIVSAKSFEDLPATYQSMITQAEVNQAKA